MKLRWDLLHNSFRLFVHLTNEGSRTDPGRQMSLEGIVFSVSPNLRFLQLANSQRNIFLLSFPTFVPAFGFFRHYAISLGNIQT